MMKPLAASPASAVVLSFILFFTCLFPFTAAISKEYTIMTMLPKRSALYKGLQVTSRRIAEQTDGNIVFNFSPAVQDINHNAIISLVESGEIAGAMVNGADLNKRFRDCRVYTLPLFFISKGTPDYIRKIIDPDIFRTDEQDKFIVLSGNGGAFSGIFSTVPIKTPDDLKDLSVWAPGNTHLYEALKRTLGGVDMDEAGLVTAIKQKKVDAVVMTPMNAVVNKLHHHCKFYLKIPLLYSYVVVVFNKNAFDSIDIKDKIKMTSLFHDAFSNISGLVNKYNTNALEVLDLNDVSITHLDLPDRDRWNSWASSLTNRLEQEGVVSKKILKKTARIVKQRDSEHKTKR